jgi:hypothetical protein
MDHLMRWAKASWAYIAVVVGSAAHTRVAPVALLVALASVASVSGCAEPRAVVLGFWLEPVTYTSSRLTGGLTSGELQTIASVARAEVRQAFAALRVTVSEQRDARYRVRVLARVRDPRFRGDVEVAGSSRAVSMFGGDGAVNFAMLAGYAESYAPPDADRATIVTAIGRGVGRAAVHEFAHQLLGSARIDDSDDIQSYEYGSAARREQYYGEMHWGGAWPLLYERFSVRESS